MPDPTDTAPAAPANGPNAPAPVRILVVKLSSLGDLFHALPAVHHLKTQLPARIDWVVQEEYVEVVRCFRDVDRVIAFPRRSFPGGAPAFLRELRREEYDHVIDFQGLLKSALVARLARGKTRLGPSFHRECSRLFYSAVAGPLDKCRHAVEENMDAARYFGLRLGEFNFPVSFPRQPLGQPGPRIGILPLSRWATKNWPVESFAAAAAALQRRLNASIFLLGGPESVAACARIEKSLPNPAVNKAGALSLVETGSLLAELQLLIANDTGPMHMAAALGVPVLAIFGATDPSRTGPFGRGHRTLAAGLPCQPCLSRQCRYGDIRCLRAVSPEVVADVAAGMLGRRGEGN